MNKYFKILTAQLILLIPGVSVMGADINAAAFGARGDGKTNDTYAIQKAIAEAARQQKTLVLNAGNFLVTDIKITCSMRGVAGKTVIRKMNTPSTDRYVFCNIRDQQALRISNIIFDGAVTGTDVKPLQGSIPLFLYSSKNIVISNCVFRNAPMAGLRIEACSNVKVDRCRMKNTNGEYGDGIYIEGSDNVRVTNSSADDYTRIGFVAEKNSRNVRFENCQASNGHDASILHGGREYNAGFWAELVADVHFINCTATNNTRLGFVISSGLAPEFLPAGGVAPFSITGCKSVRNPLGFQLISSGNPVNIKVQNCTAINAEQGFVGSGRYKNDRFEFTDCTVSLSEPGKNAVNVAGFMWESSIEEGTAVPEFIYKNCTTNYTGKIPFDKLYDINTNNADLSTYSGGTARIKIDNMKNNTVGRKPIIKAIKGNPIMEISNTAPDLRYMHKKQNVRVN